MDLRIESRRVEDLIPYARNAKQHSDAQVAQIAASIREFGWGAKTIIGSTNPVSTAGKTARGTFGRPTASKPRSLSLTAYLDRPNTQP